MKTRQRIALVGRLLFVLFLLAVAFVFAMFQGGMVSWTIFYILLPFVSYSILLFFYPISAIKAERKIVTSRVHRGGSLTVVVRLKRKHRFPLLYMIATEIGEGLGVHAWAGSQMKQIFLVGISKEVEWTYTIDRMPRGEHRLQGIEIELSDFFGWIKKTAMLDLPETILVYPKVTEFPYQPHDNSSETGSTDAVRNIPRDLAMVTGVREYQAGDRMAWIHWKSFAKTQNLMTKEFDEGKGQQLFLVLDGRQSDTFEDQVELAASLLQEMSRKQTALTFVILGETPHVFHSIHSEEQFHQAFVQLAKIKPSDAVHPLVDMTLVPHSESAVFITGNPDEVLFQSVLPKFQQSRSIVCFAIVSWESGAYGNESGTFQLARSKGIKVYPLYRKPFSEIFNEVAR
ncbi:DUF58 domain-containing protein [Sporosarcina sp. 179-K 3D1 HS]|uniref:DUF58 domain-containing protein n=1 Tax=Sporosarcina sp. 179-K 3D1 HS TaxID=3232169 RepID=UPI0039A36D09